jgi:uncharacterized protein YegJ (DUF2314 family)
MRFGALFSLLVSWACGSKPEAPSREPIASGDLNAGRIAFQFAIYYLPKPAKDPLAELRSALNRYSTFTLTEKISEQEKAPVIAARIETDPAKNYAPPGADALSHFGRGLAPEQAAALARTQSALILDFGYPREHVWTAYRRALELTVELARATRGLPWDESTREVFSPGEWTARRLTEWTESFPDIKRHTTIHTYQTTEFLRAVTLGMQKFGLPDIVVDEFPRSLNSNVGHTINLFAQTLAEGAVIQKAGEFDLDFRAIRNARVRSLYTDSLKANATGVARLSLKEGEWEDGDPENRLIEITFERGNGPDRHARQQQILASAFGSEDSLVHVDHDEELEAASSRARLKLPGLRADFSKGLRPGEMIQVKAPFDTPEGGQEWMWVEVLSWKGDRITGVLRNEPFEIPTLHSGQKVEVSESKVFDYTRTRPDGTLEGNETGAIIDRMSNESK